MEFKKTYVSDVVIKSKYTKQPKLNETNDFFEFGINYYF